MSRSSQAIETARKLAEFLQKRRKIPYHVIENGYKRGVVYVSPFYSTMEEMRIAVIESFGGNGGMQPYYTVRGDRITSECGADVVLLREFNGNGNKGNHSRVKVYRRGRFF